MAADAVCLDNRATGPVTTVPDTKVPVTTSLPEPRVWLLPAALYIGILAVMMVVSWQAFQGSVPLVNNIYTFGGDELFGGLAHYDGGWYQVIATEGYRGHAEGMQSPVAFFPGYPLAMRGLGRLLGDNYAVAGVIITSAAGLGIAVLFWQWCRQRMDSTAATTSLLALLLYPYAYYLYGVVYADTLFVFCTLLAFWAIERDWPRMAPLLAGVAGAAATFTRPVGVAVVIGLVLRMLERRGAFDRLKGRMAIPTRLRLGAARPWDAAVLLSLGGLAAYSGWLWHRFGHPFLFSTVERYWGQPASLHTWLKVEFVDQMRDHYDSWFSWGLVVQAGLAFAALATVPLVRRRFGLGYAVYLLVILLVPLLGTKDFQGLGRYGIAAFPVFALAGEFLAGHTPLVRRAVLACSGLMLVLAGAGFSHGFYIS